MSFSLLPKVIVNALTDVTPKMLQDMNVQLLMLDFDNTIVPYTTNTPTTEMENWLKNILASDFQVCVVSNSKRDRVKIFCKQYGLHCITHAKKPFSKGINECLEKFAVEPKCAAIVGDQIFTDTLGGNCAGVNSILVKAIHNHNVWLKLRHIAELPFIAMAHKRRM